MTDETLHSFLSRRKRELMHRIAALRGHIEPLERELAEIERVQSSLPHSVFAQNSWYVQTSLVALDGVTVETDVSLPPLKNALPPQVAARFAQMTIKECVVQALLDAFPDGATPAQIREYVFSVSGREILQSSLRPQMHRLKADGILEQNTSSDTWNFRGGKKEAAFGMNEYPTSRSAMKGLKDG